MAAIGITGDVPPNGLQPTLDDGIHLRWAFREDRSFPSFGYHLLRRPHHPSDDIHCLSRRTDSREPTSSFRVTTGEHFLRVELPKPGRQVTCHLKSAQSEVLTVTAYWDTVPVARVQEKPDEADFSFSLDADSITSVEITGGAVSLTDICFVAVTADRRSGWERVEGFPAPLCLPLADDTYPCPGRPNTVAQAEDVALGRIRYGDAYLWHGDPFAALHAELSRMQRGALFEEVDQAPLQPDEANGPARMSEYNPLETVLMASMQPAVAQMLGLAWVDRTVQPGQRYDYLLIADHEGKWKGGPEEVLHWIRDEFDPESVDMAVIFGRQLGAHLPLPRPEGLRAYALPGGMVSSPPGAKTDAIATVGLRWEQHLTSEGHLLPDHPVLYHLWRADYAKQPNDRPGPGDYRLLTGSGPIPVTSPPPEATQRPPDWPPFPLHALDGRLGEGWYVYQVSGIDIFGRHTPNSSESQWYQWVPPPEPLPWYFQPPAEDRPVHPFAVACLDKLGPPAPSGIEAVYLDPRDPNLLKDEGYTSWRSALEGQPWFKALPSDEQQRFPGLRVRWRWPESHQDHAPDLSEFRLYFQPSPVNTRLGRTLTVSATSVTESEVEVDLTADQCSGATLRVGEHLFPVLSSSDGSPLKLRVRNGGVDGEVRPAVGTSCSVTFPPGHPSFVDYARSTNWKARIHVVASTDSFTESVDAPPGDSPLKGTDAASTGSEVTLPMSANLEAIRVGRDHLFLSSDTVRERRIYRIVSVNIEQRTLRLDGTPRLTTPSEWTVGVPVRTYEVFLPEPTGSQQREWTLTTPVEHPVAYAQVGVSAADGRAHTTDNTRWATSSWGNRTGNEGPVGSPATIFAVRREQPLPAQLPPGAPGRVYATPADYSAQSQFTFRWIAQAGLSVHLFRALDETVFRTHWTLRPFAVDAANRRLFPAEPHWDEPKRTEVATAIETLNTLTDYAVASAIYRALPDDTLRVLAGLPGMEQAFTQITVRPLDPDEPDATEPTLRLWRDRVGPDTSPGYVPDETLRSWVDTLSGRSSNRYLYRAVSVDTAHNRSPLGVPAPPVWLPDITPPHAPVMTAVRSGEGQITLQWTSPREAGLSEFWVYRTESETRAGDLRWMQRIHTQAAPSDQESLPAVEVTWTDHDVTDGAPRYYRLVAVDQTGNVSRPTPIWCSRATDTSPPTPAVWSSARWLLLDAVGTETPWSDVTSNLTPAVSLHWTVEDPRVASLVQRRMGETSLWQTVMPWRSVTTYRDQEVTPDLTYEYRVLTRAPNGQTSTSVSRAASRED